jgi:hypothetical protein
MSHSVQNFIPQAEQIVIQFEPMKQHLEGHKFDDSEAVGVAVCKWMHMQDPHCNIYVF